MTIHTITVRVPEDIYARLAAHARNTKRSVEELLVQAAGQVIPPPIESELPLGLRNELAAMSQLSDEALRAIALSIANSDKIALYDVLLERHRSGTITSEGTDMLRQLRDEADALMVRKAHAFALLKSRGHTLPPLNALPVAPA
jgi:hypothetical protein